MMSSAGIPERGLYTRRRLSSIRLVIIVLLSTPAITKPENGEQLTISVITGVYWKEVRQATVYESSIPLVYKSKWPSVDVAHLKLPEVSGFCNRSQSDIQCMLHSWIFQVDKSFDKQMKWLNASLSLAAREQVKNSGVRVARSVNFVGKFAQWCCGIATNKQLKPLIANEKAMSQFEQVLNKQVDEAFVELDNVNLNMKNFSDQVERTFARVIDVGVNITKVIDRFQKQLFTADQENNFKSYSLLQISAHQVIRQLQTIQLITRLEILSQCRENKLPNSIVSLEKLSSDLDKITLALQEDGYELVIPSDAVTEYLKLELTECIISGENILITLKVPIRRRGAHWMLYEPIFVPFGWKNNTCVIKSEISYLAVNDNRLVSIQGGSTRSCEPYNNMLCYLPRYTADVGAGSLCPRKMFEGATIGELSSVCTYSCKLTTEIQVSQVDEFTYVITNARDRLNLYCRYSKNQSIDVTEQQSLGALEITVPCDCELQTGYQVLVGQTYPCQRQMTAIQVTHVLPAAWSRLKSLKISQTKFQVANSFATLDECINEDWPNEIPHFNFSVLEHKRYQAPQLVFAREEISLYSILSTVLHTLFMLLVILIIFRNPHLIGFGITGHVVMAEPIINEQYHEKFVTECIIVIITITIFVYCVFGLKLLMTLCNACKRRRSEGDIELVAKQVNKGDDDLPRNMPITEVDGRELQITLEWCEPQEPTPKAMGESKGASRDKR